MMTEPTESTGQALAKAVKERRAQLGLTHASIRDAGGPSPSTLQSIEAGTATSFKPLTIVALERALHWAAGSVAGILSGEATRGIELDPVMPPSTHAITITIDPRVELTEAQAAEARAAAEAEVWKRLREMGLA